jgi:hypothetical protein
MLFIEALRVQLILKGVCTADDWETMREGISVDYIEDNYFSELKDFEIMKERIGMLDTISSHIGKYYSDKWVRSNILNQSEADIERMNAEISEEKPAEESPPTDAETPPEGEASDDQFGEVEM